jgi:small redox-active disulfide protein 2
VREDVSGPDVTQIQLRGGLKVGLTGLAAALEEAKGLQGHSEEEIAQALLARLRAQNYIPQAAEPEYQKALLREYKKFLGEEVPAEKGGLSIRILGPGCASCTALTQLVITMLSELGLAADVEHVQDLKEIAATGIMGMPALLINGEVKVVGQSPTREALKKWLLAANSTTT